MSTSTAVHGCADVSSQRKHIPASKETLRKIMEYPLPKVREKILIEESLSPAVVDEAILEFRKYLTLIVLGYSGIGMISREVDEVWHTFILFTKDYDRFCREVLGFFLHHQPNIPSAPIVSGSRERFIAAYQTEFGEIPAIWKASAECSPDVGGCCGEQCAPEPSCDGEPTPT